MSIADGLPQPTPVPTPPHRIPVKEMLARFEREARWSICDTGRYRCPYFTWGEGPTLVFIPGLSDDARSFVPTCYYLSRHFRCLSYDLPAGGDDGARLGQYRHADYVDDLFALINRTGAAQNFLYGMSFGSTIALAALAQQPQRLPRAILQGGFARRSLALAEQLLCRMARYWPGPMHRLPWRNGSLRHSHHGFFTDQAPEIWNFFLERLGSPPIRAVARRALLVHQIDLRPLLKKIHQPVLLICGDHDPIVDRTCEDELLAGLPHATRVEMRNCGHWPIFSHPEVVAELVYRFLTPPPACANGAVVCAAPS